MRMKVLPSPNGVVGPEFCSEQLAICLISRNLQEHLELNSCVKSRCVVCVHAKSLQSCLTFYDPMDYSPPGPSIHGILHARILK